MSLTANKISPWRVFAGWAVHILTASTAVIALFTLHAIYFHRYTEAFWLMGAAVIIDGMDGTLARAINIKHYVPKIDGALLDNLVDFLNYVITPGFLLLIHPNLMPKTLWGTLAIGLMVFASAYQFTQSDAKTEDNFFKGFPCYWNFAVFYFYLFNSPKMFNLIALYVLVALVFIPIKYVYPSRMDNLTNVIWQRRLMLAISIVFGIVNLWMLYQYPKIHPSLIIFSITYIIFYFSVSFTRTIHDWQRSQTQ